MERIDINEHEILLKYRDTMARNIKALYPYMDMKDIYEGVEYSIKKRFKNFDLKVANNYTEKTVDMTVLELLDYIKEREPIVTSYGTMFKRHANSQNPMAKVIKNFLDLRKIHKKEMFKYPKNSEMFEHYNLLQQLDKIDANGIYGLIGLYSSFLFDLNVAPAVTSTGRSLISSAILCFEGFLGNNVQFSSLNDILTFIDNIRMEYEYWKYNDNEVLGHYGQISVDECFNKVMLNCGYKYIPTDKDMDIVYQILSNCNYVELDRIFYKNNLYSFMDLPIARDLMINIITKMQVPYIEPAKPPKEIVTYLDQLRDLLVEYVFYNHQYMDRTDRNKNMIKKISVVSDTDSSFVSLDAWYHYNIEYLKNYDCPIIHEQIDVFKAMGDDLKREDNPSWNNPINKQQAVTFLKTYEDGELLDKSILNAIEYVDTAYEDFDFYSEDIIEKRRAIDAVKIIPQDNMKFALINIMCYILSTVINLYMINFTKESGSYRGDSECLINMKNEFYMSRIMLTDVKKHYASLQILQEGNYLGSGVVDCKGIDCLTKSSVSKDTQKALRKILLEDILTADPIDQMKLIKDIAILEKKIYTDLKSMSKKYYKPVTIKSIDNYETPLRIQGIKAALAWNYVRGTLPGLNLDDRNAVDIIKINVNKYIIDSIKDNYPIQYERFTNLLNPKCEDVPFVGQESTLNITIGEIFKGAIDCIALPKDIPVPDWLVPFIDYAQIIEDNLSGFPSSSAGLGTFGAKKVNYSNVIKL